ncbi:MAG TPA: PHP domain-containing protein [Spirochaetota bacterium]|nr:PHP domain-containing protein [Spirochaetota bacterium]
MKIIDLHCHTTASDGIKSPSELIDFAISEGVEVIAITDHDTVAGLAEALDYASTRSFKVIPGIEFSIDFPGGSFHLLGLNFDHTYEPLLTKLTHLQSVRDSRIYRIIDDLAANGIEIPLKEVLDESQGGTMGRPHVARVLVKHGYAPTINDVFKRFLVRGKPGYIRKEKISFAEAMELVKGARGQSIIAHPVSLGFKNYDEFESILKGFVEQGISGIEAFSSMHTNRDIEEILRLAGKYGLHVSGGSDYHGDKDEKIGYYMPSKPVPYELCKFFIS